MKLWPKASLHTPSPPPPPPPPPGSAERSGAKASDHPAVDDRDERARPAPLDPLDPATRQAAQLGPAVAASAPALSSTPAEEIAPRARVSMEELLPQLVKRIAWAGDRRRGTVQLELGAGRHAGTTVTVHAELGRVRVELQGNGDLAELRARIDARLKRQGLDVESVT